MEIRVENEDDEKEETKIEENKHKVADLVIKNIKSDPFIHKMKVIVKNIKNGIDNKTLDSLKKNGTYDKLYEKWFGSKPVK